MEHGISLLPVRLPEATRRRTTTSRTTRFARAVEMMTSGPEVWQFGLMLTLERRPKEPAARKTLRRRSHARLADTLAAVVADRPARGRLADPVLARRLAVFHLACIDGFFVATPPTTGGTSSGSAA